MKVVLFTLFLFFSNFYCTILVGNDEKPDTAGRTWKFAIDPQFGNAYRFSEGLAAVRVGDDQTGKWGFLDRSGKFVIEPQFDDAENFTEGLARVRTGNHETGKAFIDKTGKVVIRPKLFEKYNFSEGLARVKGEDWNGKCGFINKTGTFIIPPQFDDAENFTEGLARVKVGNAKTGKWGFIDRSGKLVIEPQFDEAHEFSEGAALVKIGANGIGKKYGFIDKSGNFIIEPQFDFACSFSEGLARVKIGDAQTWKWGFIDKTGNLVIDIQADEACDFSGGLACVRVGDFINGKYGFIDKTGNFVLEPQFDFACSFSEGLAPVRIGLKWGYIKFCRDMDNDGFSDIEESDINRSWVNNPLKHPPLAKRLYVANIVNSKIPIRLKKIRTLGKNKKDWEINIEVYEKGRTQTKFPVYEKIFNVGGHDYMIIDINPENPASIILKDSDSGKHLKITAGEVSSRLSVVLQDSFMEKKYNLSVGDDFRIGTETTGIEKYMVTNIDPRKEEVSVMRIPGNTIYTLSK